MYLIILILLFSLVMTGYYRRQNMSQHMGGQISLPKTIWLGLALFYYFVFPAWWILNTSILSPILISPFIVLGFFLIRGVIQLILMYGTKNWSTKHGILFNCIGSVLFGICIIDALQHKLNAMEYSFIFYMILLILFQITDSIYAYRFGSIVGDDTKGEKAIWYASNDEKYKNINQLTTRLNTVYLLLSGVLIVKLLVYDTL